MNDVLRGILIVLAAGLVVFLVIIGLLMWRYRIPPRGVVALATAALYLVIPIDVLPEAVLGPLGLVDDAGIVGVAVLFAYRIARARRVLVESGVDFRRKRD